VTYRLEFSHAGGPWQPAGAFTSLAVACTAARVGARRHPRRIYRVLDSSGQMVCKASIDWCDLYSGKPTTQLKAVLA